jgi:photosystem II stability/assembly factor-like uncharacterized protein
MRSILCRFARTSALALALGGSWSSNSFSFEDVLDTPAFSSEIAYQHLLLDVQILTNRWIAVGEKGHILFSEDTGKTWQQADVPVSVLLTAVHFASDSMGWAVGHGGVILVSTDGGLTWTKQFDGNEANQSIIRQAEKYVAELEADLESATEDEAGDIEYELEEALFSLEDAEIDAEVGASKPFLDVYFINEQKGFVVGAYGFLFATNDGGQTWDNYGDRVENFDRFHLNAIGQTANESLIIAGEAGVMFRSQDGGDTWETVDSPYDGSWFGILSIDEADGALAFGLRGNLYKTTDGGAVWEQIDSKTTSTLMGASFDGDAGITIAGNSGVILTSRDGGDSFQEMIREDRLGNVSVAYVDDGELVLVGESGVNLIDSFGQNL